MAGLTSVYRLYPNAALPTTWYLDAVPIVTSGFKYTKRAGQASSASFRVIGASTLNERDRIFAYGETSIAGAVPGGDYTSQYPPAQSDTYVKATTKLSTNYWPYFTTDPTKPLIGIWGPIPNVQWIAQGAGGYQRFHIDLGSAKVIKRIYYENNHCAGAYTMAGVRHFTFWGSNNAAAFAELTYGIDTNWTQITAAVTEFDIHVATDAVDPKYFLVNNSTAYRYYAFKFADNWGDAEYLAVRRIELQIEGGDGGGGEVWTWGGIVFTKRQTKGGYEFGCLDFIDAVEGIPVSATYPGTGTDDTDTEILTNILTLQKSPLGLQLDSAGITPTGFRELVFANASAKSILEQFCTYGGHKFSCYQTAYNVNPKLQYFHPAGTASGISLSANQIFADWSIEKSRSTIVNKVTITADLKDVPTADHWCKDTDTADLFGHHTSIAGGDQVIGRVADVRLGFKFTNGKFTSLIKNICCRLKKVGSPITSVWAQITINAGVNVYSVEIATPAGTTTSYTWKTAATSWNPVIPPFATVYIQLLTYDWSDANYYCINATAGWIDDRLTPLSNTGGNIW